MQTVKFCLQLALKGCTWIYQSPHHQQKSEMSRVTGHDMPCNYSQFELKCKTARFPLPPPPHPPLSHTHLVPAMTW